MKKYYSLIRAFHLYSGLFISPFVLIFSISVLLLNHTNYFDGLRSKRQLTSQQSIPDFKALDSDLATAKMIIEKLDVAGEIDWISKTDSTFSFPVNKAGSTTRISLNLKTGIVDIHEYDLGTLNGTAYLHTMPGQHNASMRGNSFFMKLWRIMTDVVVYVVLFSTATGVILWYLLKPERSLGFYALASGIILLKGLLIFLF